MADSHNKGVARLSNASAPADTISLMISYVVLTVKNRSTRVHKVPYTQHDAGGLAKPDALALGRAVRYNHNEQLDWDGTFARRIGRIPIVCSLPVGVPE